MTGLKPGIKFEKSEGQLIWLLRSLLDEGVTLLPSTMAVLVDELERSLQAEHRVGELISPYLNTVLGDLFITAQCANQLELFQPWARTWSSETFKRAEKFKNEFSQRDLAWQNMLVGLHEGSVAIRAADLGEPTGGKFTYPIHKRRTRENLDALRKAECSLDAFWAVIDQLLIEKGGSIRDTAVYRFISQPRLLQRTQEWSEIDNPLPANLAPHFAEESNDNDRYEPISSYHSETLEPQNDARPKEKIKTRGNRGSAQERTTHEITQEANSVGNRLRLFVDARALKVFRTIFYNPAVASSPGEIAWNDFLHAMVSAGFAAMKTYGSVWQFRPMEIGPKRNIQFHEPHPRGKLPCAIARRFGRRLTRAYGWTGGIFLLKK